jgi:hypothetical protein
MSAMGSVLKSSTLLIVVANADGRLAHLCDDTRAGLTGACIAAVLLDDDGDTGGLARGPSLSVTITDPYSPKVFQRSAGRDLCRRGPVDAAQVDIQCSGPSWTVEHMTG